MTNYLPDHLVGFRAQGSTIPSKHYRFGRQLGQHGSTNIHAAKKHRKILLIRAKISKSVHKSISLSENRSTFGHKKKMTSFYI